MSEPITREEMEAILAKFMGQLDAKLGTFAAKADLEVFATKADLEVFATKADLEVFATKADLEVFATKADLEAVETRLLTAFIKWARPFEMKARTLSAKFDAVTLQTTSFDDRVTLLEERISEVERQLLQRHPPAA